MNQPVNSKPIEVYIESEGGRIHGRFYRTKGKRLSPTVILYPGFPGIDDFFTNLIFGFNEIGFNALCINYLGTWKSEGIFTVESSLQSVISSIEFIKSEDSIKTLGVDASRISLVGSSYGGGLALQGSLHDRNIHKVISIAGLNFGDLGRKIKENPDFRKYHQQFLDDCMADLEECRGLGGKETHELLLRELDRYDLKLHVEDLAKKEILLIGGWQDSVIKVEEYILPLYRSLQIHGADNIEIKIFDTDHSFSNVLDELTSKIITWLLK